MHTMKKAAVVAGCGGVAVASVTSCSNQVEIRYHDKNLDEKKEFNEVYSVVIEEINKNGNKIEPSNYYMEKYRVLKSNKKYLNKYFNIYDMQDYDNKLSLIDFNSTVNMNPTYEMVVGALDQNNNLAIYKELAKEIVTKNNSKYPDFNLTLLMYNAPDLTIREIDTDTYFTGKYNPYTNTILINTRYANTVELKKEAFKDAFGYCYTNGYIKENKTLCSDSEYYLNIGYMSLDKRLIEGGKTFKDGFAAHITNDVIDANINPELSENVGIFRFVLSCVEMPVEEYEKSGFIGLIEKTQENRLNEMIRHFIRLDDPTENDNKCSVMCDIVNIYWRYLDIQGLSDDEKKEIIEAKIRESFDGIISNKNVYLFQLTTEKSLLLWMEKNIMQNQKAR